MSGGWSAEDVAPKRPRRWVFWLRLALTLSLVGYVCVGLDWLAMQSTISGLRGGPWCVAFAVYLASQVLSARRWSGLSRAVELDASGARFLRLYFEGMFFSLCLPTSIGGDVVKAYRLAPTLAQRVLAGCTVLVDRLTGLTALLTIVSAASVAQFFALGTAATWLASSGIVLAAACCVRVGLELLRRSPVWVRAPRRVLGLFARLRPYADKPRVILSAVALSFVIQALNVLTVYWVGEALGLGLPVAAYFVAVPLVALVTALPLSIAGVGLREGGLALVLGSYGLPTESGVALGLMWFLVVICGGMLGGLCYLFGPTTSATGSHDNESPADEDISAKPFENLPTPHFGTNTRTPQDTHADVEIPDADAAVPHAKQTAQRKLHMDLSIVVPVYNEQENIPRLYEALVRVLDRMRRPYELLFIDDGSQDGSTQLLFELAAQDANVKVVEFRRNFGQTAAMNAGIQLATGDVIVMLDADLQNDPEDISMMVRRLEEGYDLVHGWRKERQDAWLSRKLPSKLANGLISRVTGFPVHDLGCTLKVVRREIAQEIQLYGEMHRFIPILCHWRGARCLEVVTRHHPRRFGQSKYGLSRTFRVLLDLITVKYMIGYLTSPMRLFGTFGLWCMTLGGLCGGLTVAFKLWRDIDMTGNPLLLATTFLVIVATQFFVLGMLGEVCVRTYYESQGARPYAIRRLVNFAKSDEAVQPRRYESHAA